MGQDMSGQPVRRKTKNGWLVCQHCERSLPYIGMPPDDAGGTWPEHRCPGSKHTVRPFTRWTEVNPNPLRAS